MLGYLMLGYEGSLYVLFTQQTSEPHALPGLSECECQKTPILRTFGSFSVGTGWGLYGVSWNAYADIHTYIRADVYTLYTPTQKDIHIYIYIYISMCMYTYICCK